MSTSQEVKVPLFYRSMSGVSRVPALPLMETTKLISPPSPEARRLLNTQVNILHEARKAKR